jgi:hypothetical protein
MKGNFHVRFLERGGLATARPYSALRLQPRGPQPPILNYTC